MHRRSHSMVLCVCTWGQWVCMGVLQVMAKPDLHGQPCPQHWAHSAFLTLRLQSQQHRQFYNAQAVLKGGILD